MGPDPGRERWRPITTPLARPTKNFMKTASKNSRPDVTIKTPERLTKTKQRLPRPSSYQERTSATSLRNARTGMLTVTTAQGDRWQKLTQIHGSADCHHR